MSLATYLEKHFIDKPKFASLAAISVERLDQLIEAGAVPTATYVCDGKSVHSAAFGATEIAESIVGEYFRPECVRWVQIADRAPLGSEKNMVEGKLIDELRTSLVAFEHLHHTDAASIEARIRDYLPSFFDGTFGLCVADPSTGNGIAEKEILQEKLTAITGNGSNAAPAGLSKSELLGLIDDYANAAMPFSPADYARSSRKRLVDDLRPMVTKA